MYIKCYTLYIIYSIYIYIIYYIPIGIRNMLLHLIYNNNSMIYIPSIEMKLSDEYCI